MLGSSRGFAGFSVDDTDTARTFYEEVLGLEVRDVGMYGLISLHLGGDTQVIVYPKGDDHRPATFTVLNFPVADLEGTVDGLAARGVTFERYPQIAEPDERGIHRDEHGGPAVAWFTDPAGNIMAVMSEV